MSILENGSLTLDGIPFLLKDLCSQGQIASPSSIIWGSLPPDILATLTVPSTVKQWRLQSWVLSWKAQGSTVTGFSLLKRS